MTDTTPTTIERALERVSRQDALIAELRADLADKASSLKTANAALTRICEVIGAPVPACPDDAVEAVKTLLCESEGHNARADRAEATLAEMVKALDDAGAPRHYLDDDGRESAEVPAANRIRILAEIARSERVLREQTERNAAVSRDHMSAVALTLDDAGAPRQAGSVTLSPAARIRAIVR